MQPTIRELFDTRQFQTAALSWLGKEQSYYDYIKETWETQILNGSSWNVALQAGVFTAATETEAAVETSATAQAASDETASTIAPLVIPINAKRVPVATDFKTHLL